MERGPAEEAVVIVKSGAEEAVVTSLRVKRQASGRRLEVKGGTRKRSMKLLETIGLRSAEAERLSTRDVDIG